MGIDGADFVVDQIGGVGQFADGLVGEDAGPFAPDDPESGFGGESAHSAQREVESRGIAHKPQGDGCRSVGFFKEIDGLGKRGESGGVVAGSVDYTDGGTFFDAEFLRDCAGSVALHDAGRADGIGDGFGAGLFEGGGEAAESGVGCVGEELANRVDFGGFAIDEDQRDVAGIFRAAKIDRCVAAVAWEAVEIEDDRVRRIGADEPDDFVASDRLMFDLESSGAHGVEKRSDECGLPMNHTYAGHYMTE